MIEPEHLNDNIRRYVITNDQPTTTSPSRRVTVDTDHTGTFITVTHGLGTPNENETIIYLTPKELDLLKTVTGR